MRLKDLSFFIFCLVSSGTSSFAQAEYDNLIIKNTNDIVHSLQNESFDLQPLETPFFCSFIDSCAFQLKKNLGSFASTLQGVDSIISLVYNTLEIRFNPDKYDINGMLPQTVLNSKKGSCLGVTLLMLILGEMIGCPLYGVILPGHVFVRFDNGIIRRNIEPNKDGICHPDEYYRKRYLVSASKWYDMHNSSINEILAILHYNIANTLCTVNRLQSAEMHYLRSLDILPTYAEAWGNLAILFDGEGKTEAARNAFKKAESLQPDMFKLGLNYGYFELKHNNEKTALYIFEKGLLYYPNDNQLKQAYKNLLRDIFSKK